MALSRQFLNLIVDNRIPGAISLRCIDLTRQHFFNTTTPPQALNGSGSESDGLEDATSWAPAAGAGNQKNNQAGEVASRVERIQLPSPLFNFRAATMTDRWAMHCFPLAGREVLCADQSGRTFLFDADTRHVLTMPDLHKPKKWPLSLFVPSASVDDHDDSGGTLFIMESLPRPETRCSGQHSDQFEAFVYRKPTSISFCQPLPPPPFVLDPKYRDSRTKISSYAVIEADGGNQICISVEGAGTYCLHMVNHTWTHLGDWTLPFRGRVEYVPELKLWFGLCAKTQHLAAADLSALDSQPELMETWKELSRHKNWWDSQDSQLVNLGSGRFCIARFFHTRTLMGYYCDQIVENDFAVLTCVDVAPCLRDGNGSASGFANANGSSGKVKLQMIKYKSKFHSSSDSKIMSVF
uniref:DUF1618 domain-containing protein n=1 Tax=Arundo donax TaxID=35708 RepID=A0A0A9DI12_ARUDO